MHLGVGLTGVVYEIKNKFDGINGLYGGNNGRIIVNIAHIIFLINGSDDKQMNKIELLFKIASMNLENSIWWSKH